MNRIDPYRWSRRFLCALSILAAASAHAASNCPRASTDVSDSASIAVWLKAQQWDGADPRSRGALRMHHSAGYNGPDGAYFRVVPYFASLGVLGLLKTQDPQRLVVAERWIAWYLSHMGTADAPPGGVTNHWYLADGSGETTCPAGIGEGGCDTRDSDDSYAATLLLVVDAYRAAGGSTAFLGSPGMKAKLEGVAELILSLQQSDGLTWAKDGYRVKYLMDNSEVYAGLHAMARIEKVVYGDPIRRARYESAAKRVRDGIARELHDGATGLYRVNKPESGAAATVDIDKWYPDAMALVWPQLFGVADRPWLRAMRQWKAINAHWDGDPRPAWATNVVDPDGFTQPAMATAALRIGDCTRARQHVELVRGLKLSAFDGPFNVGEAGWWLTTLSEFR